MPIPNQYINIIEALRLATAEGRVFWIELGKGAAVVFDRNALELSAGEDASGRPYVAIGLRDAGGVLVDSFSVLSGEPDYDSLLGLHNSALRKAHRVDEILVKLNAELKKDRIGLEPTGGPRTGRALDFFIGRWTHEWDEGAQRKRGIVTISDDGTYICQVGGAASHFKVTNPVYSPEKREARFDLIKPDGTKDSTQIFRVEHHDLLVGAVEGAPSRARNYTRLPNAV